MKNRKIKILSALVLSLCFSAALPVFAENESPQTEADSQAYTDNTLSDIQQDAAPESTYAKGTSTENGFQSEWLNLQFTPPAYMVMSSEEELQSIIQYGQNTLQQTTPTDENAALPETVYEMMAASSAGFPNVSVVVETSPQESSTPDQYFTALKQLLDATQLGYQYEETVTDTAIAGQDFRVLTASLTMNRYQVFQKYCTRKQGDKFVSIILSYTEDTAVQADEVLASFTALHTPESPEGSTDNAENQVTQ